MRTFLVIVSIFLVPLLTHGQSSGIYSFQVDSIAGQNSINFASFQGKKILIVCTASQDSSFSQYEEIKQLYQLYKDSLVIVVFPTHSFNTEPGGNPQIAPYYNQAGLYKFPVAEKVRVTNPNIHPLFAWLTDASQNGMMNSTISRPCFKYLIGKSGQFVGVYGQRVRPMSSILRNAIESSN